MHLPNHYSCIYLVFLVVWSGFTHHAIALEIASEDIESTSELLSLSLEELMDLQVSTLTRKEQSVKNTPAAAFVITSEDIRRSGATNLPDILRMVPGMDVGKINNWNTAVSARGSNDIYTNKLQVMVDGRSIYDPLTSGVYWGQQNGFLQNIEQIEVIRGSSGTLWGPNAVNGTINIITRNASDTQGGLINAGAGNKEDKAGIRYGTKLSDSTFIRGTVNTVYRDASTDLKAQNNTQDFGNAETGNFRLDSKINPEDKLMVEADFSRYDQQGYFIGKTSATPPLWSPSNFGRKGNNSSLQGNWTHETDMGHDWKLNMAFTYSEWQVVVNQLNRTSLVLDFHDSFPEIGRHTLLWGVNYQTISDQYQNSLTYGYNPDKFTQHNFGVFLQDQIQLLPDLKLTLANRVDHFTFTGWETEPNARLMWTPNKKHSVWAAISRSVVLPNRAQHGIYLFVPEPGLYDPTAGKSTFLLVNANPAMKAENLLAYELGWRWQLAKSMNIDTALFYNVYDHMQGTVFNGPPLADPVYGYIQYGTVGNYRQVDSYGVEVSLKYQVNYDWHLQASYSDINFITKFDNNQLWVLDPLTERNFDPQQTVSLRSLYNISSEIEFDAWGRYVDKLFMDRTTIPAYFALDLRLGWHPTKNLELSLSGQNLLDNQHPEFSDIIYITVPSQIQRSYFAQVSLHF